MGSRADTALRERLAGGANQPTTRAGRRLVADVEAWARNVEHPANAIIDGRALTQLVRSGVILAEQEARHGR